MARRRQDARDKMNEKNRRNQEMGGRFCGWMMDGERDGFVRVDERLKVNGMDG